MPMTDPQKKICELYALTAQLEAMHPGRRFTPDGHMVGSIGEVIAAEEYGLELFEASHPVHDVLSPDGRLVQVKATQGRVVALNDEPDYLIVLRILGDGSFEEAYNGRGKPVWNACGKMKTGQRLISLSRLGEIDVRANRPGDCIPHVSTTSMARFCREWLPLMGECLQDAISFLEFAYGYGIVVSDYAERVSGLDARELAEATPAFVASLDDEQLVGAIAWHIRQDHWDEGSLVRSVESGSLPKLMGELAGRYGELPSTSDYLD